jgi:hypothetical protein
MLTPHAMKLKELRRDPAEKGAAYIGAVGDATGAMHYEIAISGPRRLLEADINRALRSCGCTTGGVFVFIGIVSQVVMALAGHGTLHRSGVSGIGFFVASLFVLALVGKTVGIVGAEWRVRRAIDRTLRRIGT